MLGLPSAPVGGLDGDGIPELLLGGEELGGMLLELDGELGVVGVEELGHPLSIATDAVTTSMRATLFSWQVIGNVLDSLEIMALLHIVGNGHTIGEGRSKLCALQFA